MGNLSKEKYLNSFFRSSDLRELNDFLKFSNKKVYPTIKKLLNKNVNRKFKELVEYQVSKPGKMLRSALFLLSYMACNGKNLSKVAYIAGAIEILHNATLVVDDIIDDSAIRRKAPSLWKKYCKSSVQIVSFIYVASVYNSLIFANKFPIAVAEAFSKAIKEVSQGELYDILCTLNTKEDGYLKKNRIYDIDFKKYVEISSLKTSSLFKLSCYLGALEAGADGVKKDALSRFGTNIGILFQITDDILDMQLNSNREIEDVKEGKINNFLTTLFLENEKNEKLKKEVIHILEKSEDKKTKEDYSFFHKYIVENKNLNNIVAGKKDFFCKKCVTSITSLPNNKYSYILRQVPIFIAKREY